MGSTEALDLGKRNKSITEIQDAHLKTESRIVVPRGRESVGMKGPWLTHTEVSQGERREIWGWMVARGAHQCEWTYCLWSRHVKTYKDGKSHTFVFGEFHHNKNKWKKFIFFSSDNLWKELISLGVRGKKKARTIESICTTKAGGNLTFATSPRDENYHHYVLKRVRWYCWAVGKHRLWCWSGYNYSPGWALISPFEQRRNDVPERGGWEN